MYIRLAMDTILLNIVLSRFTFTPVKSLLYNRELKNHDEVHDDDVC